MNRGERKAEVFDANLHEVSFDAHRSYDVAEMRRRLEVHLRWYDHARAHHALGGQLVPADRYYGRSAEVLACIEAGAGRDAGDGVALRERCLEPFKVTSRGGVPEVWPLRATPGRAEDEAHVEGAFGLFSQILPELASAPPLDASRRPPPSRPQSATTLFASSPIGSSSSRRPCERRERRERRDRRNCHDRVSPGARGHRPSPPDRARRSQRAARNDES